MHRDRNIYMTTTYNPAYDGLRSQVLMTWDLLDRSSSTRQIHSLGLQVGYRRPKNLRDMLVKSKLPSSGDTLTHYNGAPPKCDNSRCRYCQKLNTDGHIVASVTGKKYRTRHNVSCNSNNLVYCISCTRCGKQYVGQTKNSLKQRFQGHFYLKAHDAEKTEVSRHFNGNGHQGIKDVGIHILDFVHQNITKSSTIDIILGLKFDWIHRLHCLIPKGLNSLEGSY